MALLISNGRPRKDATASSPFFKLPAETRSRVYVSYFESHIISITESQSTHPRGALTYQPTVGPCSSNPVSEAGNHESLRKRRLPKSYEGQLYMSYSTTGDFMKGLTGDVLTSDPVWSLLCASRQVYLEAVPLLTPHVHFSFTGSWLLCAYLTAQQRATRRSCLKFPTLMTARGDFASITSIQVRLSAIPPGSTEALGTCIVARLPRLRRFVIDVSMHSVVNAATFLPRPWLADTLWPVCVRPLEFMDSTGLMTECYKDEDARIVMEGYYRLLERHC